MNDARYWRVSDHVCRLCFGRVLVRTAESGDEAVRCAECGVEAEGGPATLCACGWRLATGKPAGMRCIPNPDKSISVPEQVVVVHSDPEQPQPPRAPMGARGKPPDPDVHS